MQPGSLRFAAMRRMHVSAAAELLGCFTGVGSVFGEVA